MLAALMNAEMSLGAADMSVCATVYGVALAVRE
jgi:hypothetical protein